MSDSMSGARRVGPITQERVSIAGDAMPARGAALAILFGAFECHATPEKRLGGEARLALLSRGLPKEERKGRVGHALLGLKGYGVSVSVRVSFDTERRITI
jgi:hypothetical protein